MPEFSFPLRTIHLDFHTGPDVPDVGCDFDADRFARTFKDAHVDSVTVFATCHHGHAYYRTDHPCRHPNLSPDLDLTGSQIEALHRAGLRAPIYVTGQVNEYAANTHPEWVGDRSGRAPREAPGGATWRPRSRRCTRAGRCWTCRAPTRSTWRSRSRRSWTATGRWTASSWTCAGTSPGVSQWAVEGMTRRNLDPRLAEHRARYARQVALDYMRRFSAMVEAAGRGNRPPRDLVQLAPQDQPAPGAAVPAPGGRSRPCPRAAGGYAYFPYVARFVRPLGLPTLTHTGRFFKSWGDNARLKQRRRRSSTSAARC